MQEEQQAAFPFAQTNPVEIRKHSSIIQMSNRISAIQRKSLNVLMYTAREELLKNPQADRFRVPLSKVKSLVGSTNSNNRDLKVQLIGLMKTVVGFNLLGKDDSDWKAVALLAEAGVKDGYLEFAFAPTIRETILNPKIFAKLNLQIMSGLVSKYAIALYEVGRDYIKVEVPKMSIEKFREWMGLEEGQYTNSSDLKKRVIDPAVQEVNEKTDIHCEYEIIYEARKAVEIKFWVREQSKKIPGRELDAELEEVFESLPDDLKFNDKFVLLLKRKLEEHTLEYVLSNIQYARKNSKTNLEAYAIAALEEDFASGDRAKVKAATVRKESRRKEESKKADEEEQQAKRAEKRREDVWSFYNSWPENRKKELLAEMKKTGNPFYHEPSKTIIVNYLMVEKGISFEEDSLLKTA